FYFGMHLNQGTLEVNPIDLIAVEVLRMFDHDAFVAVSKSFFQRHGAITRSIFRHEELPKSFQADIDAIAAAGNRSEGRRSRLKALLQAMFPQATGNRSENEWKRD